MRARDRFTAVRRHQDTVYLRIHYVYPYIYSSAEQMYQGKPQKFFSIRLSISNQIPYGSPFGIKKGRIIKTIEL